MNYTIQNDTLTATFSSLGAELISLKKGGKEYIWQNPTGEWAGHAPVLFPACGRVGVTVDGVSYPLPFHGVARKAQFTLEKQSENSIAFVLYSNAATKEVFPFDFIFRVIYTLSGATLTLTYAVENPADKNLYFACGSHEAYALDGQVDEYEVEFEKKETLRNHLTTDNKKLSGETVELGSTKVWQLPLQYLQNSDSVILKDIRSRKVVLRKIGGENIAEITFEGFSNMLFWREMDGKFICIEPWTNLPDYDGVEDCEFKTKAGVMEVAPHTIKTLTRTITLL